MAFSDYPRVDDASERADESQGSQQFDVQKRAWQEFSGALHIPQNENFNIDIEDRDVSAPGSVVQIKDLLITEVSD